MNTTQRQDIQRNTPAFVVLFFLVNVLVCVVNLYLAFVISQIGVRSVCSESQCLFYLFLLSLLGFVQLDKIHHYSNVPEDDKP